MNKKGITFFYTLMLGIIIIVFGMAAAIPVKQFVDTSKTDLSCSNPATMFDEAGCYGLDFLKIIGTSGIILIGVGVITAKVAGWI